MCESALSAVRRAWRGQGPSEVKELLLRGVSFGVEWNVVSVISPHDWGIRGSPSRLRACVHVGRAGWKSVCGFR